MKTLGQRIKELRDQKDLSLRELSQHVKVSAAFLSDVELGRRNPRAEVLERIAVVLGTTVEDLKKHDTRLVMDDIKRLTTTNPMYGFAFRKAVESNLSPEDLMKAIERERRDKKRR